MKLMNSVMPAFLVVLFLSSLAVLPAYCNSAEAGSSTIMTSGSISTSTSSRFVTSSGEPGVELNHDIRVTETTGSVTAYMNILSMEGRGADGQVFGQVNFRESTTLQGLIRLFDKQLKYESALAWGAI